MFEYQIIILLMLFVIFNYFLYNGSGYFFILTSLCGIILTMKLSAYIENNCDKKLSWLTTMGIMSMDIYILSDIIKIPIRIILWNKLHLYNTAFLICLIISLVGSIILSKKIIRKNKMLSKLVLGM